MTNDLPRLTDDERAVYEWQLSIPNFGEEGQRKLKAASVLISRVGGVGGAVAYYLAAAGVGRLILAHAGDLRPPDLNRQILMTHDGVGQPRIESAKRRLLELNPRIDIVAINDNLSESNAADLVSRADLVVDCAPLFAERLLMNRESVRQRKPMVECAMYAMEAQVTTFIPGRTPCLACLYPVEPPGWQRRFPVFGAVAGVIGSLAAVEVIKTISGLADPLLGKLLTCNLAEMSFRT
ncbi:MAG: moeB 1, partial [Phycisphaerales bacterium]|nr:moeB 1 [Phycisphaerales bacterium]